MSSVSIRRLVNIVNVGNNTAMLSGGTKQRLDKYLVQNGLIASRSQAENYIRLGDVMVNNKVLCSIFSSFNLSFHCNIFQRKILCSAIGKSKKREVPEDLYFSQNTASDFSLRLLQGQLECKAIFRQLAEKC